MKTREHHHPTSIPRRSIDRPILGVLLMALIGVSGIAQPVGAIWDDGGTLITTYSERGKVDIVTDDAGGAIVAWESGGSTVVQHGVYVQRIGRFGELLWTEEGVLLGNSPGIARVPELSADGAGGAIITWARNGALLENGIYAQKLDASGSTLWASNGIDVSVFSPSVYYYDPHLAVHDDGSTHVAWVDGFGSQSTIAFQRITPSGSLAYPNHAIVGVANNQVYSALRAISDGANGVLLGWQSPAGEPVHLDVRGQLVDELGRLMWVDSVVSTGLDSRFSAELVSDGSGHAIWAWEQLAPTSSIRLQRSVIHGAGMWGANGTSPFPLASDKIDEQITSDRYGGAIVVVASLGRTEIAVNRILADGSLAWSNSGVSICNTASRSINPQIAPDGFGGAYIAWEDDRNDIGYPIYGSDIFAQHIDADGNVQWASNGVNLSKQPSTDQWNIRIVATGSHDAIVIWADGRRELYAGDLYAQMLHYDGAIGQARFSATTFDPPINEIDVAANTNITVDFSVKLASATLNSSTITVHGSIGGLYDVSYSMPSGPYTLVMQPSTPFAEGEVVTVVLTDGITAFKGNIPLPPTSWSFTTTSTAATALFPNAVSYGVQNSPTAIYAADINSDGAVDLLTANLLSNSLSLLKGNGDGSFAPKVDYTAGNGPISILASDLDLDGDLDVVVLNRDDATLSVFDGRGGSRGLLLAPTSYATGGGPRDVCSGDFNDDGYIDLATANRATDDISVLLNDQAGGFAAAVAYPAGNGSNSIASADLNKDGFLDLVCSNDISDDVSIFLNLGTGAFAPAVHIPAGNGLFTIQCADVDDDEDIDLIVAATTDDTVILMKNRGDATFTTPIAFVSGPRPRAMRPADVDGDGLLDLVYADVTNDQLLLRLNDGSGGFGAATSFAAGNGPDDVVAADFDGDGDLDLATVNLNSDDVTVLMNGMAPTSTDPTPALVSSRLWPNVPNPFNPRTEIEYSIARDSHVRLEIYNARGALVSTLVDGKQNAGMQSASWDGVDQNGNSVPSGVYYYRLGTEESVRTRRMTLIK